MAYLKDIMPRVCRKCGKPAKVELNNSRNAAQGDFCQRCGSVALKNFRQMEEESLSRGERHE